MADKNTRWRIEATSNLPELNKQIERLIQLQVEQNQLTEKSGAIAIQAMNQQKAAHEQLLAAQSKANTSAVTGGKQQSDMIGGLRKEYDLLSKQLSGLVQLAAGAFAVGQLKTYVMEVINAKSAQDGFVASMEQMLGSRLKAEELNAKLIAIALKSPFQIDQLQEVTKKLQGMGVETEKLIPYINMLGDIAAIVGTQKLPLIAKALTDVQSKHVLMAQEIRQFTDNGVPLYDLLAKSMQKPVEEIRKLASEHKIVFADVEKALMQATEKGGVYYNQMSIQAKQLGGQVSNLGDLYTQAKAKIGDYFENGLRSGIKATGEFITATIGSENAITRTITSLKAALAVWISYRTAVLTVEAAKRANNVTTLASLAGIEASTVATVGLTGVTTSLSGAFNGLKVAFMANPFGMIATAVTSLISIFYAYKAVNIEVAEAQSIEAEALRKTNTEISNNIERVKGMTVGTAERKKAIEELIAKYPELFKNLDAESIGNAQLETIMKRVNAQYREKINLAIIDAKNSSLLEKQMQIETERYDTLMKLREKYKSQSTQFTDDSAFLAELARLDKLMASSGTSNLGTRNLFGSDIMIAQARALEAESKRVQESITKNVNEQAGIRVKIDASEQNQKITELRRQLRNHEITVDEFNKKVEALTKESSKKQAATVEEGEDAKKKAKKSTLELSLENDVKELKSMDQTFAVKMQLLNKQEALAIEQAKRTLTNREQEEERVFSIQKEYAIKRGKLALESVEDELKSMKKWFDERVKSEKFKNDTILEFRKDEVAHWKKHMNEIAKLDEDLVNEQLKNQEKLAEYNVMYKAEALASERKFWQDKEIFMAEAYIKENEAAIASMAIKRQNLMLEADALKNSQVKSDEYIKYQKILIDIEVLTGKITEAEAKNFKDHLDLMDKKTAKLKEYMTLFANAAVQMIGINADDFIASLDRIKEQVGAFYDYAMEANRESFNYQVENMATSVDYIIDLWEKYAARQTEILDNKQAFNRAAENMKNLAERSKESAEETNKFTSLLAEGKWVGAIVSGIMSIVNIWKKAKEDRHEMQMQMMQEDVEDLELRKTLIGERLQAELNYLNKIKEKEEERNAEQVTAAQEKYAQLIDEAEAYYAKLTEAEQQYFADSTLRAKEDEAYRRQLMLEGEAREVKNLQDAMARQIQYAKDKGASDQEIANITNSFNAQIAQVHADYQDAMGNKSKETSLATEELKNQEKDKLIDLKAQEAQKIDDIQNDLQSVLDGLAAGLLKMQTSLANAIVRAQYEAAKQTMEINRQIFEANRAMAIADIDFEIAKQKGKANPNPGAMTALQIAKADIQNIVNPYGGLGNGGIIDAGTIPSSRGEVPSGRGDSYGRPNSSGGGGGSTDPGSGDGGPRGDNTPRGGFHGDTWLRRDKWDPDGKYGLDEIYMRTQEGERLMPLYLNQFLGPKVTNQELVHGYLQYANFKDRLPDTSVPNIPQMIMPDFSQSNQNVISMERVESKLDELNQTFAKKSLVKINVDGNKISISELWESHKITYYDTLFNK